MNYGGREGPSAENVKTEIANSETLMSHRVNDVDMYIHVYNYFYRSLDCK